MDYLKNYYSAQHAICIYEAAVLPSQKPGIDWMTLGDLLNAKINASSTLYIPPVSRGQLSDKYLSLLEIDIANFKLST